MTRKEVHRLIDGLLESPIAYHRIFATISGSATAGLLLSQMWYWTKNPIAQERNGWFYNTIEVWEKQTGLTRYEQETARKKLRENGFVEEKKMGVPCRLFYRVNVERVYEAVYKVNQEKQELEEIEQEQDDSSANIPVWGKPTNKNGGNQQTSLRETSKSVRGKAAGKFAGNQQAYTEITSKTSPKNTQGGESRTALQAATPSLIGSNGLKESPIVRKAILETCAIHLQIAPKGTRKMIDETVDKIMTIYPNKSEESLAKFINGFGIWWTMKKDKSGQNFDPPSPTVMLKHWGAYVQYCMKYLNGAPPRN